MQTKRGIQRGRPIGATTFEAAPAQAFGAAVRAIRIEDGIALSRDAIASGKALERLQQFVATTQALGYPYSRSIYARLLDILHRGGARLLLQCIEDQIARCPGLAQLTPDEAIGARKRSRRAGGTNGHTQASFDHAACSIEAVHTQLWLELDLARCGHPAQQLVECAARLY